MRKPNTIEDEIDRIRLKIYEETKGMTPAQRAERTNKNGEAIVRKYGLAVRVVSRADEKTDRAPRQRRPSRSMTA